MLSQLAQGLRAASRRSTAFRPVAASLRAPPPLAAAPHRSAAVWTPTASFHASGPRRGLEEFYDARHRSKAPEDGAAGRAWEACELRRKSFNDLHRLWWTLYKERNVLLTESARARRNGMRLKYPQRKAAVRKSMARIKQVLADAPRNQYTAELHLQMIKYADELKNITAKEFCEGVGLRSSFGTEFSKMRNLTQRLKAAGLNPKQL